VEDALLNFDCLFAGRPLTVSLALLSALMLTSGTTGAQITPAPATAKKPFTIEAIYAPPAPGSRPPSGLQWSPDGTRLSYIQPGEKGGQESLASFDAATGKSSTLIPAEKLAALVPSTSKLKDDRQRESRARFGVSDYQWAPDSKELLFDALGQLWLYDLAGGKGRQLTRSDEPSSDPKFSPDGRYVSYLRAHDLYVRPVAADANELRLTHGGNASLLNGEVDWLYSEELDVRSNYFWSPDSRDLLYLQTDESPVPQYPIVNWMATHPETDQERYPKAGDPNPRVRLFLTALKGRTHEIALPLGEGDYIPRFGWVRPGLAWAMVLNRAQNQQDLYFIDAHSGHSRRVLRESEAAYIELHDPMGRNAHQGIRFLDHSDEFLWLSWRDGFTHIYLYGFHADRALDEDALLERQLDAGPYQVGNLTALDEPGRTVYFTANKNDDRSEQLFRVSLNGGAVEQVTCQPGTHSAVMSEDARHYVDTFSTLTAPPRMNLCATAGECHELWASHAWDDYDTLTPQFVDFKAVDGTVLHGVLLLPSAGAATEKNGRVPLILNPYGGPQAQVVRDSARVMDGFDQVLAHRGFAVLKVDNRGMGNRGRAFALAANRHLGEVELTDQLAALDQALARFPQLDATRVGFWGWSYGGFMTGYTMTHSVRFKAGVSVAPVTDWHLYDSTYTERYMGLPKENEGEYQATSIVNAAPRLSGRLLLVHGTSDDNVHLQNSIQFINAMVNAGRPFDLQLYPGKTHGIAGPQARTHLFNRILWHFEQYLAN
jgi:dipeptidyl-peptidase-4